MKIHKFFHIFDNEIDDKTGPLFKIRLFLMHFYLGWRYYYNFSQLPAIDEFMIKLDAPLGFKQYI